MKSRYGPFLMVGAVAAMLVFVRAGACQALYSYVDDRGIRTFTNIPPTGPVRDLRVTGVVPAATTPAKSPSNSKKTSFDPIIDKYAAHYQLDPQLVKSMIAQESGFKSNAVSSKGARGLMQLMPETAARLGVRNSFDPEENLRGGMKHMRNMLDMFNNDLELSLAAYNAGENLVQKIRRVPSYLETRSYVSSITSRYGKKQHELAAKGLDSAPAPLYRYTDRNGVLHLTNLPPVQRPEIPSLGSATNSP